MSVPQLPLPAVLLHYAQVPPRNAVVVVAISALAAHMVFKRWEVMNLLVVSTLLLVLPTIVSSLLVPHFGALQGLGLGFLIFFGTLLSSITLYRVSPLHPLARYPGPVLAKVSKLYHVWRIWPGKQHIYIQRLHDRYGDMVRIGPNEVSIRDASCITPVLGAQGLPKGPMFNGRHLWPETHSLIGFRDPKEHQRRRRPWNRAFNSASVKEFNPIIQARVHELGDALAAREGQVLDLAEWIGFFTYDFMGDMVFGGWTHMVRDGADHNGLWKLIKSGLKVAFVYEHVPWLSYYAKKLPGAGSDVKQMRAMAFGQTEKRYAAGTTSRDLFYYLGNEDGAEKADPPKAVVMSDGVTALIAGSDTTSSVLASLFYCLLRSPEAYARLQAEVDKFYPRGEDALDPKHIPDMQYLEAVINEGLRLFPAVPSGSQRAPEVGKGDRVVGPYFIPEGTQTRVHFWSVHRDARNFSHPDTFWPERWLIAEGAQAQPAGFVHNANAWVPFSFGPSNCVGKNLALQEMRMLVCHLVQRLRFRFADGYDPAQYERDMEDRFVVTVGRLPVVVERRDQVI
ncbi:cytochrome P450 [Phanerochaete sordida]|uniref:Cytochrome P450 n=1 Tax=Phanerochaete sordida TaxID=48140 RepID=A0A9P3GQH6_9APHY|nr:cytochrome P450 [Phanerochaete sordida]